jgi:hypothetical protein
MDTKPLYEASIVEALNEWLEQPGHSVELLAAWLGITTQAVRNKLERKVDFWNEEMLRVAELTGKTPGELSRRI